MTKRSALQLLAVTVGFVTALALFNFLKQSDFKPTVGRKTIGQIVSIDGQLERRGAGAVGMEKIPGPGPIYHQDLLITQGHSNAKVVLEPGGPILLLEDNTRAIFELDPTAQGSFQAVVLDGSIKVIQPGQKGMFRLFKGGTEIPIDGSWKAEVPVITADSIAAEEFNKSSEPGASPATPLSTQQITATQADEFAKEGRDSEIPKAQDLNSSNSSSGEKIQDVLTNDEIVKSLRSQTHLFQRCYLTHLHRKDQEAKSATGHTQGGRVIVSFTIQNSGKVTGVKTLQSDFKDNVLQNCVTEVIERSRFKSFSGQAVFIQEFPIDLR